MPRKTKTTAAADKAAQPQFSAELLEKLIPGLVTSAEQEGIFQQLKKSILDRALGAEIRHYLGDSDVIGALESATVTVSRKVNPTLYTPADGSKRLQQDNAFVTRVWPQPKIWLIGHEEPLHASSP